MGWHEELVFTETSEEGAGLSGLLTEADRAVGPAVIYIHGFPIDAFLPFSSAIARGLASRGYTTLQANTRGAGVAHQIYCRDGPSMLGGGWLELFSESPRDIDAWITFMESRGISRVVLLGVSFGGLKTVYYLTERADPRVAGAIVAQAPMPGADRINSAERPDPERVALARRLVAEGRELDFLWRQYGDPSGAVSARRISTASGSVWISSASTRRTRVSRGCAARSFSATEATTLGSPTPTTSRSPLGMRRAPRG